MLNKLQKTLQQPEIVPKQVTPLPINPQACRVSVLVKTKDQKK